MCASINVCEFIGLPKFAMIFGSQTFRINSIQITPTHSVLVTHCKPQAVLFTNVVLLGKNLPNKNVLANITARGLHTLKKCARMRFCVPFLLILAIIFHFHFISVMCSELFPFSCSQMVISIPSHSSHS